MQIVSSSQVEVVFPQLSENGELVYSNLWYYLPEVSIPVFEKHKKKIEFQIAKNLSNYIKEHLKTEKEIEELNI